MATQVIITSESIANENGLDMTWTRKRVSNKRVKINTLSIHFSNGKVTRADEPQQPRVRPKNGGVSSQVEEIGDTESMPSDTPQAAQPVTSRLGQALAVEQPGLVSIRSTFTTIDPRSNSERHITVGWRAESPDSVFVSESAVSWDESGKKVTDANIDQHVPLGDEDFDPRAIKSILLVPDDKARMEFLSAYLPNHFLLNA